MEGIAFVVGVSKYNDDNLRDLESPAKDAKDLSEAFGHLKYEVISSINEPKDIVDNKWNDFKSRIQSEGYDTSIVFFSGHGMHVNNSECLFLRDATAPSSLTDSRSKAKSLILKDLMDELDELELPVKIFIIDACRTLSKSKGSGMGQGIRLSEITKQTFVAYASAIGEPAQDGDTGKNSVFTDSLLKYIDEENLSIEHLFKKVRLQLIEKAVNQTPWEHTCLVADFAFNHGQLSKYYKSPYSESAFKIDNFQGQNEIENQIISGLRLEKESKVSYSLELINSNFRNLSPEFKFVAGRLISRLASRGNKECLSLIDNASKIKVIDGNSNSSLLKGIFYDLYYDENDELRTNISDNIEFLNSVERLRSLVNDKDAENFIGNHIQELQSHILYRIGSPEMSFPIRFSLEETGVRDGGGSNVMYLKRIYVPSIDLDIHLDIPEPMVDRETLRIYIAQELHLPIQDLQLSLRDNEDVYTTIDLDDLEPFFNTNIGLLYADDIDSLSSNSYIECVDDVNPQYMTKEDSEYIIKGDCTLTVHMEFDHEEMNQMVFPSRFSVRIVRTGQKYHFEDPYFRPDIKSYYK